MLWFMPRFFLLLFMCVCIASKSLPYSFSASKKAFLSSVDQSSWTRRTVFDFCSPIFSSGLGSKTKKFIVSNQLFIFKKNNKELFRLTTNVTFSFSWAGRRYVLRIKLQLFRNSGTSSELYWKTFITAMRFVCNRTKNFFGVLIILITRGASFIWCCAHNGN